MYNLCPTGGILQELNELVVRRQNDAPVSIAQCLLRAKIRDLEQGPLGA
jgi:hypothetical protein